MFMRKKSFVWIPLMAAALLTTAFFLRVAVEKQADKNFEKEMNDADKN